MAVTCVPKLPCDWERSDKSARFLAYCDCSRLQATMSHIPLFERLLISQTLKHSLCYIRCMMKWIIMNQLVSFSAWQFKNARRTKRHLRDSREKRVEADRRNLHMPVSVSDRRNRQVPATNRATGIWRKARNTHVRGVNERKGDQGRRQLNRGSVGGILDPQLRGKSRAGVALSGRNRRTWHGNFGNSRMHSMARKVANRRRRSWTGDSFH